MKHNIIHAVAAFVLLTPVAANAQRIQQVPETVQEISIEGKQKLTIMAGDETRLETTSDKNKIATVRSQGTRMIVNSDDGEVTLRLSPWRSIRLHAEDYSTLEFSGSLDNRESLTIETEDYAQAVFLGDTTDTVRAVSIILRAEDFSSITSNVILQHYNYELSPTDYSRIILAGLDQMHGTGTGNRSHSVTISDHGKVYRGRCTDGGHVYATEYPKDDDIASRVTIDATDRAVDLARDIATNRDLKKEKKDKAWSSGDFSMRFAWGWHNWGNDMFSGFGSVDGPAELNTSMNNVQLEFNYSLIESSWMRLDAGLGLEWNKFKFSNTEVLWNNSAEPYTMTLGTDNSCITRLKTRYVTLPITLSIGERDGWHVELSAIPGLGWTGKNTGLRREYASGNNKVKDYSINRSLSPYKLDIRAAMMYDNIGVYFQVATLSTFKENCDELFPIKFGIIL